MPFLRLQTATPTETEMTIMELRRQLEQKDRDLTQFKEKMRPFLEFADMFKDPESMLQFLKDLSETNYEGTAF